MSSLFPVGSSPLPGSSNTGMENHCIIITATIIIVIYCCYYYYILLLVLVLCYYFCSTAPRRKLWLNATKSLTASDSIVSNAEIIPERTHGRGYPFMVCFGPKSCSRLKPKAQLCADSLRPWRPVISTAIGKTHPHSALAFTLPFLNKAQFRLCIQAYLWVFCQTWFARLDSFIESLRVKQHEPVRLAVKSKHCRP